MRNLDITKDIDLEEAAEKHASMHPLCNGNPAKNSFIAGAEWQKEQDLAEMAQSKSPLSVAYANRCFENGKQAMKEQMMKEAVEGTITCHNLNRYILVSGLDESLTYGDKVRIIICKKED